MTDRNARRLLRHLRRGPATLQAAATSGRLLADCGDAGVIGIERAALETLVGAGLVARRADRIELTPRGRAAQEADAGARGALTPEPADVARGRIAVGGAEQAVAINLSESPLAMLRRHKTSRGTPFLDDDEFRAGERLRRDYTRGRLVPRLGVNWSTAGTSSRGRGDAGGIAELTDAAMAARQRVEQAIEAVGPELAGVLIDVCCFLKGLERVEAERCWPVRSAKVVLKAALAALARHYAPPPPRGHANANRILHWGADDYRPRIA